MGAIIQLLVLLVVANGAPILARKLLKHRWYRPIDAGKLLASGAPLLGPSKTWRGLAASLCLTPVVALMLGLSAWLGLIFAALAMTGDLLTSFIKRRIGMPASSMALGFDYLLESLLPVAVLAPWFDLTLAEVALTVLLFMMLALVLSWGLYHLGIRKRPY